MIVGPALEDRSGAGPEAAKDERRAGAEAASDPLVRFAGGIAHDFNNLLTVVNGYSELILEGSADARQCREYVREIWCAGNRAAEIVEMILAYTGVPGNRCEEFDAKRLLEGMRDFLATLRSASISVTLGLCPEPLPLRGHPGRLGWALANVILNAKEAMPGGGHLDIWARLAEASPFPGHAPEPGRPCAEIGVRDTGRGMAKPELDRVFEPYFTTKKGECKPGLGMGLACAQGIVRQFGGCIRAESEPGKGSAFRLLLPLVSPPPRN